MRIIEIDPLDNGAHRNQSGSFSVFPKGWAIIPDDMVCENFPFGDVTVDESAPPVVARWTPGEIPAPEPEPESEPTEIELLRADVDYIAMEMGVDL